MDCVGKGRENKASRFDFIIPLAIKMERGHFSAERNNNKLDILGHHMWEKVLLGLIVHTQRVKERKGEREALPATSLGSINNG